MTIAELLFGPEYRDSISEEVGTFGVPAGGRVELGLLPPGGYVFQYLAGAYFDINDGTYCIGGPSGIKIQWQAEAGDTTTVNFLQIDPDTVASDPLAKISWIEFTAPHRACLLAPRSKLGNVAIQLSKHEPHG